MRPEGDTDLGKELVFISHIGEEIELAILLSEEIKSAFSGIHDTFVSSDSESIPSGSRWLDKIDAALEKAAVMIILCSPQSIRRPWINFEAGTAWIRRIPLIPLCHSGLAKTQLPTPLSALESSDLDNQSDLAKIFGDLTKILDCPRPDIDLISFIERCRPLIHEYTYLNRIKQSIQTIVNLQPQLKSLFFSGEPSTGEFGFKEYEFLQAVPELDLLKSEGLIDYVKTVHLSGANEFRGGDIAVTKKYLNDVLPLLKRNGPGK
jgi:hypothetical protein